MDKRKYSSYVMVLTLMAAFCGSAESGPTRRLGRMVREVYPEIQPENEGSRAQVCIVGDVVYGTDEAVPADQPCLKCKCRPPGVQCETIQCAKRPGCKAIHRPNKCCPDYQCECEHHGKSYANGEKLETPPGGECKVCYCRGGEVQCAEVSCYIRKDCEGKRVPGTCCPRYDHCPSIDPRPTSRNPYELRPMTGLPPNATEIVVDIQENKIPYEAPTSNRTALEVEDLRQEDASKITIQEIIPEIKEIPVTASPKLVTELQGTLIIEEDLLSTANDLAVTDADAESSELSEVFQQPPPVLRIGDKLLFLKKGENTSTPGSVITLIGAEGLQRGFEESAEAGQTERPLELAHSERLDALLFGTAAATHEQSLVKRKNQVTTTTEGTTEAAPAGTDLDPAYPPLPEILDDASQRFDVEENATASKILPEVLSERSNKTVPTNTNATWLKSSTEELLKLPAAADTEDTTTAVEATRSVESLEDASDEAVTATTGLEGDASVEETTSPDTQLMIDTEKNRTSVKLTDVELVDTSKLASSGAPGPGAPLKIIKRESWKDDEASEEDDEIFKGLLEEIKSPGASKALVATGSDPKRKYGDALARFSLKDGFSDPSVIGLLADYIREDEGGM